MLNIKKTESNFTSKDVRKGNKSEQKVLWQKENKGEKLVHKPLFHSFYICFSFVRLMVNIQKQEKKMK